MLGEEDEGQRAPPALLQPAHGAAQGASVVTDGEHKTQESRFYSLKRCRAAFSGLHHTKVNVQCLEFHGVLLEFIRAMEVLT